MPSAPRVAFAVAGVALVLGGGYAVALGAEGDRACGSSVLVADPADGSDGDENRVAFADLTDANRDLAERAIDGERPALDSGQWPWAESAVLVEYQGERYRIYTVTTECTFPPAAVLGVGALGALAGLGTLALAGRGLFRDRVSDAGGV